MANFQLFICLSMHNWTFWYRDESVDNQYRHWLFRQVLEVLGQRYNLLSWNFKLTLFPLCVCVCVCVQGSMEGPCAVKVRTVLVSTSRHQHLHWSLSVWWQQISQPLCEMPTVWQVPRWVWAALSNSYVTSWFHNVWSVLQRVCVVSATSEFMVHFKPPLVVH